MELKIKDKVAIVTGAARGIGEATARAFGREGASVVVVDIAAEELARLADEMEATGQNVLAVPAYVARKTEAEEMVRHSLDAFGTVDILVNNAGVAESVSILDLTEEAWDRVLDINLKSVLFCSQAVIPTMIERQSGRIINMGSMAGKTGGRTIGAHYVVSKAGVMALTKSLAYHLSAHQIAVNALAPGIIATPLVQATLGEGQEKRVPLGRLGDPEEVADLILFLASDRGGYITGEIIDINGGMVMD